ncbi:MAG TPA: biotin transporter BioY [Longilinea sp.]|nr:biotin transporter BioY [Longilinea sp.]
MYSTLGLTVTDRISLRRSLALDIALVAGASLVLAGLAQIRIYLPFTPVPVSAQTLGVLLIAAVLGSRRGVAAVITYILEGIVGLPFFAGGNAGLGVLTGVTGGYLIGFVVAAAVVGYMAERGLDRKWWSALTAFLTGTVIIYAFGATGLAAIVGWQNAFTAGVLPFLLGDAFKIILAAILLPSAWALIRRWER